MTDNEIIKALECCIKSANMGDCLVLKCPLLGDYGCAISGDEEKLYEYALDLINRQKAEIERLNSCYEKLHIKYENIENELKYQQRIYKTAKSEAIKEFAERLKENSTDIVLYGEIIPICRVERLVKEMKEERE